MIYAFSETERCQLLAWLPSFSENYSVADAARLEYIIQAALTKGFFDENDVSELLDLLPRIIPSPVDESKEAKVDDNPDWNVYLDEHQERFKREIEALRKQLSNWLFMQSVLYRKSIEKDASESRSIVQRMNSNGIIN